MVCSRGVATTVAIVAMPRWAGAPGAPASSCGRSPVATERSAVGTLPVAAARRGDRSRFEVVVRTLPALRGRRRKAEELGDNGFGGAQHRGDQRRQVEAALAGGGARRWRGPAGCRRRGGCGCRRTPCG